MLTGAPGAGKTTVLRELGNRGYHVIDEAATDVIAQCQAQGRTEPWEHPDFLDSIITLQRRRQEAAAGAAVQIYDRSPLCTLALARYLCRPVSRWPPARR
ncbi:MAG TPA: AAA family ATPase [Nonomuraea sp.]|nr:AAA family ATPase [Nonomuraea sp.]